MITTKPLLASELMTLDVQEWQRFPEFELTEAYCTHLVDNSVMPTGVWIGDVLVAAGGAFPIWEGRAEVWMLLSKKSGDSFIQVHRAVQRFVRLMPYRRLETTCEIGWEEASRWLRMLGFEYESTAKKYMPSGRDIDIYVRVR